MIYTHVIDSLFHAHNQIGGGISPVGGGELPTSVKII